MGRSLKQFCEIQPKIHCLGLIKRKTQTKNQDGCSLIIRNVKVMKVREKLRNGCRERRIGGSDKRVTLPEVPWPEMTSMGHGGTDTQEVSGLVLQQLYV